MSVNLDFIDTPIKISLARAVKYSTIAIGSISGTVNYFNVPATSASFIFTEDAINYVITIAEANYNIDALSTAVQNAINTACFSTYTVVPDATLTNNLVTITETVGILTFGILLPIKDTTIWKLGFQVPVPATALPKVSDCAFNMSFDLDFNLISAELPACYNLEGGKMVESCQYSQRIPVFNAFGFYVFLVPGSPNTGVIRLEKEAVLSNVTISLTDPNNNNIIVDNRGLPFHICLSVY